MRVLHDGRKARIELSVLECRFLKRALMMAIVADQTAGRLRRAFGLQDEPSTWTRLAFDLADALTAVIDGSALPAG